MAKLLPNGKLSGSIGNITYAPQPDGTMVAREKPTGAGEKILFSEDCARSRENFTEFGRAVRGATLIRHSLHKLIKGYGLADSNLSGRVNSIASKILKSDGESDRGQRRLELGQVALLKTFAFREDPEQAFEKIFHAPIAHTLHAVTGKATLQLLPCHPGDCIMAPAKASHFRLILQVASIRFNVITFDTVSIESTYLSMQEPMQQPLTLQAAAAPAPDGILLTALGVVFYAQQADGSFAELTGGTMAVIEAKKGHEGSDSSNLKDMPGQSGKEATGTAETTTGGANTTTTCRASAMILPIRKKASVACAPCTVPTWLTAGITHDEETIDTISEHMEEQTNSDDARFAGQQQQHIHTDGPITVQRMIADTTAAGIEDGIGQQVIEVNEHRQQQYDVEPEPPRTIDQQRDEYRKP